MEKIRLDIGGHKYHTTLSTLLAIPSSEDKNHYFCMLQKWNMHRWDAPLTIEDEPIFVDRDGEHFRYILGYLRHGNAAILPASPHTCIELKFEADFYGLGGLSKSLSSTLNSVRIIDLAEGIRDTIAQGLNSISLYVKQFRSRYRLFLERKIETSRKQITRIIRRLKQDSASFEEIEEDFLSFFKTLDDAARTAVYESDQLEPRTEFHLRCKDKLSKARGEAEILRSIIESSKREEK